MNLSNFTKYASLSEKLKWCILEINEIEKQASILANKEVIVKLSMSIRETQPELTKKDIVNADGDLNPIALEKTNQPPGYPPGLESVFSKLFGPAAHVMQLKIIPDQPSQLLNICINEKVALQVLGMMLADKLVERDQLKKELSLLIN